MIKLIFGILMAVLVLYVIIELYKEYQKKTSVEMEENLSSLQDKLDTLGVKDEVLDATEQIIIKENEHTERERDLERLKNSIN